MQFPSAMSDWPFVRILEGNTTFLLTCFGFGVWLLFSAVNGEVIFSLRGYTFFILRVKSAPFRIACFVLSLGLITAAVWMLSHPLSSLQNP